MAAASTMRGETRPSSRREGTREGRARGTGAHWTGSRCLVPLSFSVARGGDARGGEEAVPAAPPPPPPAVRDGGVWPAGAGGQGASPGRRGPLGDPGLGWPSGAVPADSRRSKLKRSAACATGHSAPSGPEPGAPQRGTPREKATRPPASGQRPPSRSSLEPRGLPTVPWDRARGLTPLLPNAADWAHPGRPRTSPVRSAQGLASPSGWSPASATCV
jgi:hypothetical protein